MALCVNREHQFAADFKASEHWVKKFLKECGLCSRKVTSFVTVRNHRDRADVEAAVATFMDSVKKEMKRYPLSAFCNVD